MVGCRLTPEFLKKIDSLVDNGDFTSRGEFLKYAVRQTLKRYEGRSPPPLGLKAPERPRRAPTATAPAVVKSQVPMAGYKINECRRA